MKDLSLHILDIAENSIRAGAELLEITVNEDVERNLLILQITDNGKGMAAESICHAVDPFYTTKSGKRFGMGLALLAQATREAEGNFEISSKPECGSTIKATFCYNHPDRKPLGDIVATLETILAGNRTVDFIFKHRRGNEVTRIDTRKIRQS